MFMRQRDTQNIHATAVSVGNGTWMVTLSLSDLINDGTTENSVAIYEVTGCDEFIIPAAILQYMGADLLVKEIVEDIKEIIVHHP